MTGFSGVTILHARIKLPKASFGKSKGPRIVYVVDRVIKVLYIGGHKDKIYNGQGFTEVIKKRLNDNTSYYSLEEYMELTM